MLKKSDKIILSVILYLSNTCIYSASKGEDVQISPVSSLSRASGYISENSTESDDEFFDIDAVTIIMPVRTKPVMPKKAAVTAFFTAESRNLAHKRAKHKREAVQLAPIVIPPVSSMPDTLTGAPKGGESVDLPVVDLATLSPASRQKILDKYYELL